VDIIAPGVHILGLRAPNSAVDQANPTAVVGARFFRGSGTSQAAAVVSGLAALYLSAKPGATPDQVKWVLMHTATAPTYVKALFTGLGVPDVNKAIGAKVGPATVQLPTGATGTGSLEGARGTVHATDGVNPLQGERDIFGQPFISAVWAAKTLAGTAWDGGAWNGTDWTGAGLSDADWAGSGWASHAWSGNDWSSHAWSSHAWSSHAWSDNSWDSHAWSDSAWDSHAWSSTTWSSHAWSDSIWE
jgi:serine protease AprX